MKRFTFVLHDETVNTYGFRMLTSGANLEEFRKNPVILLNHKDWELPIGRWENIRIEGTQILADALFDEKDDEAVKIADKVEGGFLRMASMGAWPPEEVSDAAALTLPGQTLPTVQRPLSRSGPITMPWYFSPVKRENLSISRMLRLSSGLWTGSITQKSIRI